MSILLWALRLGCSLSFLCIAVFKIHQMLMFYLKELGRTRVDPGIDNCVLKLQTTFF